MICQRCERDFQHWPDAEEQERRRKVGLTIAGAPVQWKLCDPCYLAETGFEDGALEVVKNGEVIFTLRQAEVVLNAIRFLFVVLNAKYDGVNGYSMRLLG